MDISPDNNSSLMAPWYSMKVENTIELTSERALENRIADIEVASNNEIDETSTISNINNGSIDAFKDNEQTLQQSVDLTA